jgi:hypothetical protein
MSLSETAAHFREACLETEIAAIELDQICQGDLEIGMAIAGDIALDHRLVMLASRLVDLEIAQFTLLIAEIIGADEVERVVFTALFRIDAGQIDFILVGEIRDEVAQFSDHRIQRVHEEECVIALAA